MIINISQFFLFADDGKPPRQRARVQRSRQTRHRQASRQGRGRRGGTGVQPDNQATGDARAEGK